MIIFTSEEALSLRCMNTLFSTFQLSDSDLYLDILTRYTRILNDAWSHLQTYSAYWVTSDTRPPRLSTISFTSFLFQHVSNANRFDFLDIGLDLINLINRSDFESLEIVIHAYINLSREYDVVRDLPDSLKTQISNDRHVSWGAYSALFKIVLFLGGRSIDFLKGEQAEDPIDGEDFSIGHLAFSDTKQTIPNVCYIHEESQLIIPRVVESYINSYGVREALSNDVLRCMEEVRNELRVSDEVS